MGKKPAARQPSPMWVTTADLPTSAGHPFFERLNRVLEEAGFDAFVEGLCAVFYASRLGRPSLRPGRYFRLLFIGYFEGLSSERGIAWRVADSLSLRAFLDLDVTEAPPNHSTLSRTRRLTKSRAVEVLHALRVLHAHPETVLNSEHKGALAEYRKSTDELRSGVVQEGISIVSRHLEIPALLDLLRGYA